MYYYKNVGYYKGIDGKYHCSISYNTFKSKREVKRFIKKNKIKSNKDNVESSD